jgi:hypothetical protein
VISALPILLLVSCGWLMVDTVLSTWLLVMMLVVYLLLVDWLLSVDWFVVG